MNGAVIEMIGPPTPRVTAAAFIGATQKSWLVSAGPRADWSEFAPRRSYGMSLWLTDGPTSKVATETSPPCGGSVVDDLRRADGIEGVAALPHAHGGRDGHGCDRHTRKRYTLSL
jgi:hypothetical protein